MCLVVLSPAHDIHQSNLNTPVIVAVSPHGVISFGGLCTLAYDFTDVKDKKKSDGNVKTYDKLQPRDKQLLRLYGLFAQLPTGVANVLIVTPILKHVMGLFGIISASKTSLVSRLKGKNTSGSYINKVKIGEFDMAQNSNRSFILYPGGMMEMFLSNPKVEKLYLLNRKGFIKMALVNGADIIPTFLFGNTSVLNILYHPLLEIISRKLKVSLTLMHGRFLLPIPHPVETVHVRGKIISLPKISNPSDEEISFYHKIYIDELVRLFETYKIQTRDYKHKKLVLI